CEGRTQRGQMAEKPESALCLSALRLDAVAELRVVAAQIVPAVGGHPFAPGAELPQLRVLGRPLRLDSGRAHLIADDLPVLEVHLVVEREVPGNRADHATRALA